MGTHRISTLRSLACSAQDGKCFYCYRAMGREVTAEHLKARMDGGRNARENIVAACRYCNQQRHALFGRSAPGPDTYGFYVLLMLAAGLWGPDHSGTSAPKRAATIARPTATRGVAPSCQGARPSGKRLPGLPVTIAHHVWPFPGIGAT
ncbi:HNH endonuclease [Variovorax paradoxus]|nr:HNH endonuclease [Variovorax paradoxus]